MNLRLVCVMFVLAMIVGAMTASADVLDPGGGGSPPAPTPIVLPPGLYLVTDIYAGSVVLSDGGTTTYSTLTVRATPGTYARVLDVVGTGAASAYDGRSFNGRGRLTDGRLIAGTYYETFVLTPTGFVAVNIVFFQDDSETRTLVAPTPVITALPAPPSPPSPPSPPRASSSAVPLATPVRTPFVPAPTLPPLPVAAAAIALASDGPTFASIEVLRGRRVELWPRAFVDGVPVTVRSWRVISGSDGIARTSGTGAEPAESLWLVPSAVPLDVRFEVVADAAGGRTLTASISVLVRSPALQQ